MVQIKSNSTQANSHASSIESAGVALGAIGQASLDGQSVLAGNSRLGQALSDNQAMIGELNNLITTATQQIKQAAQKFTAADRASAETFKNEESSWTSGKS
ncbi:TIGR04197 family type VII secretion effector [Streptococcus oricebi]|nr:TIGR04197 family type VII secretion effector [Streptococcus oricebi]